MLGALRSFNQLLVRISQRRFVDTKLTKDLLRRQLFSFAPISKNINRNLLAFNYSPGVGAVSLEIQKNPALADQMTLRNRCVAVVGNGDMLNCAGKSFMPMMDWAISQIKSDGALDALPFVIGKETNIDEILADLSNSYGCVIYLENGPLPKVPQNLLIIRHAEIVNDSKCEVTALRNTARTAAFWISQKRKGIPSLGDLRKGYNYVPDLHHKHLPYPHMLKGNYSVDEHSLMLHKFYKGKMHIQLHFRNIEDIRPHFSEPILRALVKEPNVPSKSQKLCAIVTDGTAILGYGNIGPMAGMPVMEGKSLLFWSLGDVEVIPLCINPRKTPEQTVQAIVNLCKYTRAINLEDIKAPECFAVEQILASKNYMPVFHDDQHGTAIVTLAALINAAKLTGKKISDLKCVINGAGAAGITIAKLLIAYGLKDIIVCDSVGAIYKGRKNGMNSVKDAVAIITNKENVKGSLQEAIKGTDVFIGVSVAHALKGEWIKTMNKKAIVFALANPIPEVMPDEAKANGAYIYGSGRSDFENQINNSLVFPGIFKGIIEHDVPEITQKMKICAAEAIANSMVGELSPSEIIPDSLDKDVAIRICQEIGRVK